LFVFVRATGLYLKVGGQERRQRELGNTCSKGPQARTQTQAGCIKELQSLHTGLQLIQLSNMAPHHFYHVDALAT